MNETTNMSDRKWAGFEQILRTPPKEGQPPIIIRDGNGVSGDVYTWSAESGRWDFTGVRLQDIPPIVGEPQTRTSIDGRRFTWNPEKQRWWGE